MRAGRRGRPGQQTEQFLQSPGAGQSQFDPSSSNPPQDGHRTSAGVFGSSNGAFAGSSAQEVSLEREGSRLGQNWPNLQSPAPTSPGWGGDTTQVMRTGSPRPPAAQGQPTDCWRNRSCPAISAQRAECSLSRFGGNGAPHGAAPQWHQQGTDANSFTPSRRGGDDAWTRQAGALG